MTQLARRPTVIGGEAIRNDYIVRFEARSIGRIRQATERAGFHPCWTWAINPPLPIPTWGTGQATSLEGAKASFRQAWERFYGSLTPHDIQHWHHHQDAGDSRREVAR
jgi:hypothetical protein